MATLSVDVRKQAKEAEAGFQGWAEGKGWEIHRNGWPDFLCVDRRGHVIYVEAKSGNAGLTKAQRETLAILTGCGLSCYIWTEESGLIPVRSRRVGLKVGEPEPHQTCDKPPQGLPRRLWEAATLGTKRF